MIKLNVLYTRPPLHQQGNTKSQGENSLTSYLTPQNSSMFFFASRLAVSATSRLLHFPRCAGDTHLRKRMNHACAPSCHPSIIAKPSLCPPSTKNHPNGQGSVSYARAQLDLVLQGKPQPENAASGICCAILAKYVAPSTMQKTLLLEL